MLETHGGANPHGFPMPPVITPAVIPPPPPAWDERAAAAGDLTRAVNSITWYATSFGLGGALVAGVTVVERAVHHRELYPSWWDALEHLCMSLVCTVAASACVAGALWTALWVRRQLVAKGRTARWAWATLVGVAVAVVSFELIVSPSKFGGSLGESARAGMQGAVAAGCAGLLAFSVWVARRRPWAMAWLCAWGAVVITVVDLHRYTRSYGNIHMLLQVAALVLAGSACGLFTYRAPPPRHGLGVKGLGALWVAALAVLLLVKPTQAARRAVLVYGGMEKTWLRHVMWPFLDGDGDGAAHWAWGTDCDDADAQVHPLDGSLKARVFACEPGLLPVGEAPPLPRALAGLAHRNLVWITVDTLRRGDSTAFLDGEGAVPFGEFEYYTNYQSCSSITKETLNQLLGTQGRPFAQGHRGFLSYVRAQGYHTVCVGNYGCDLSFDAHVSALGDGDLLAQLVAAAAAPPTAAPVFIYGHVVGGHAPYTGTGSSPHARYVDQLHSALAAVGAAVRQIPPETVVLVMGDHGEEFGEHDDVLHGTSLYQEVLETPLLIKGPLGRPGGHPERLGCEEALLKLAQHLGHQGLQPARANPYLYAQLDVPRGTHGFLSNAYLRSLQVDDVKVIWQPDIGVWELYDIKADPAEVVNLADSNPPLFSKMAASLLMATQQRLLLRADPSQ